MRIFFSLVTAALLGLACRAAGTPATERGRPFLETYAPGDYHGHQQVFAITQSSLGFVYFSNFGAVMEYDGAKWRGIGVTTSWIREMAADDRGRVWLGGTDELGWCEMGADGVTVYHSLIDQLPGRGPALGTVWSVVWHEGAAWFATDRQVLRWSGERFEEWTFSATPLQRLLAGGRRLWLVRRGDGLYRWAADHWALYSRAPEITKDPVVAVIDQPGNDHPIVGLADGRMWRVEPEAVTPFASELDRLLTGARLTAGVRLSSGLLALSTHGQGVLVLDEDGKLVQRVSEEEGLPSSSAYRVVEDRESGVWIGTNMGAARVELGSPYTLFGKEDGRGSVVALAQERSNGVLYLGSDDGVRRLVTSENGKARFEPVPGGRFRVYAMMAHEAGLLVGTEAGLARLVDGALELEVRTPLPVVGVGRSRSEPDRVFVGFPEAVVTYRRDVSGAWIDEGPVTAFSGEARTLVEAADGVLWIGTTQRGYARVRRAPGQSWQQASVEYFRGDRGLPAIPGWARVVDAPGGPWFSTGAGLFVFDSATETFLPAPPLAQNGMAGMYSWPVASGREGELWAQVAVTGEPLDLEHPDVFHLQRDAAGRWSRRALPKRIVNQVGYYGVYGMLVEPGVVWLSGQRAIVRIETDRLPAAGTANVLPLQWRRISRADRGALRLTGPTQRLPFSKEPLRVEFAQPGFSAGGSAEYSHRLLGFSETWSEWRPQAEVELTNLPAGSYTLEVRSRTSGESGGAPLAFGFRIDPPWYWSGMALAGYCGGAFALVVGLVHWRERGLRRSKVSLEKLVAERTHDLQAASERAEAASRAKTLFLASVSHELRTPLHAILGYAQLLENDRTLGATTRDRLRVVGASGRHLLRLINEVLDLSKIEAGKQELRAETFNLPALLAEVADGHETRAHAKGLALRRPHPADMPNVVSGDASKLRQVLDNLMGNAVKFTPTGEVALKVTAAGQLLRFEVIDTGPGISAEDQARLFQPFHQAGGNRPASMERGTGLGLAITQRLVHLMGGEVRLESVLGHGSRFWFELTLPVVGVAPEPLSRIRDYRGRGRRVLVVDDLAVNRALLRQLLEPIGFVVDEAETAEEVLASAERLKVDLMILDLRLPGMSGLELARQLRGMPRFARLPILAASASALDLDPRVALEAGCNDFLAKPFLAEDLTAKLAKLLDPDDPLARGSLLPFVPSNWSPGSMRTLHAAAREGDVLRVREEISRLRAEGAPPELVGEIERRAKAFDLDGVAEIVAGYLPKLSPGQE